MNTHQQVSVAKSHHSQSQKVLTILIVFLSSMLVGLIPLITGATLSSQQSVIPTEAELWNGFGE